MRAIVTGAAGFIGSHMCERLIENGIKVVGIDNFSPYYDLSLKKQNELALLKKGVNILDIDLRYNDLMEVITKDVNHIFHFAAQPGISSSCTFEDYHTNNVIGTQRLLDAIEPLNKKPYFVNLATSSIYGLEATMSENQAPLPASWYGVTKLAAEQLVLAYSRRNLLKGTSLRLYSVYGPRERPDKLYTRLIDCGLNDKVFPLYKGSEKHLRSFTYVQDIIDGIMSVIGKEEQCNGEIFNLGTEEENSTAIGIQTVESVLQKNIKIKEHPPRPGDQNRTKANIDKARRILGYDPKTNLTEGIEAQVKWFKDSF
jgi:nucleoside-diphosphate-sugar epimerase